MKENNGIIAGLLLACFPGAMRVFSLLPRHYFFIIAIVAAVVSVLLFVFRKKYKSGWIFCIPVIVISLLIGIFMYSKPDNDSWENITIDIIDDFPKDMLERASQGDLEAQEGLITIWLESYYQKRFMSSNERIEYKVKARENLEMIRKYASLTAENNSAVGYFVSAIMKSSGLGGDRLKNQAVADYMKAIELDPNHVEWYIMFLSDDSLSGSHPELHTEYSRRLEELEDIIDDRVYECACNLGTLLLTKDVSTEELLDYLDRNQDDVHIVLAQRQDLLGALLTVLVDRGCLDRIKDYERHVTKSMSFHSETALPHVPEWELSRLSMDIDSLISISADEMLDGLQKQLEIIDLDTYATAVLRSELAHRKFLRSELGPEEYDTEMNHIEKTVITERNKIAPIIGQDKMNDTVYVLKYNVEKELQYSDHKLKSRNYFQPFLMREYYLVQDN